MSVGAFEEEFGAPMDENYGPWFDAGYDGECVDCFGPIEEGDHIRADGCGGWLCEFCGKD